MSMEGAVKHSRTFLFYLALLLTYIALAYFDSHHKTRQVSAQTRGK